MFTARTALNMGSEFQIHILSNECSGILKDQMLCLTKQTFVCIMKMEPWCLGAGSSSVGATKEQAFERLRTAEEHWIHRCLIWIILDWASWYKIRLVLILLPNEKRKTELDQNHSEWSWVRKPGEDCRDNYGLASRSCWECLHDSKYCV